MLAETLAVEGAVPLVGLMLNQLALLLALQFNVPPPELVILSDWLAGLDPLTVALKLKLDGLTPIVANLN